MISAARLGLVSVCLLAGCTTVKKAAVTSFRVIDTPRQYLRDRIEASEAPSTTTTTTTTTVQEPVSDVVTPGRPVAPGPQPPPVTTQRRTTTAASTPRQQRAPTTSSPPRPSASPAATPQYPVARAVPDRPGYVYSLDPNGGIVDVTGYKSGDRAKDPYTKKIFIVP